MQHQQESNNMNDLGIFHNQDRNLQSQPDNYNWNTKPSNVNDEKDAQSIDNILDRSGLLDELVCQILDDGSTPVEEEKPSQTFRDAVHAKEFVPSSHPWTYGNNPSCLPPLNANAAVMGLDTTDSHPPAEQLNMGQSLQDTGSGAPNTPAFTFIGKHVTSTGKVINPPPGFENELQAQNTNLNDLKQSQIHQQNSDLPIPNFSGREPLGHNTLSSDMFSPNEPPSNQPIPSDYMPCVNVPKPFPDASFDYHQRLPFPPTQMAQSLFQRRTNSPLQLLLSETGSGSSPGSIDSPILSPNSISGMSNSNPSSPFETNLNSSDKPISVSQANPVSNTRFNFKAPPFYPNTNRPSPSPLGWKGADNNPFKFIQQRSESPVEQRPEQKFPYGNMPHDPPPTNRMLKGNFPMQPLPLPFDGKPFSTPQDIPNFKNAQGNLLQKNHSQPTSFFNSRSGRSSPFPFPTQQPAMGPHGDSFHTFNRFNHYPAAFSGLKQQGFPGTGGFPNKFANSGNTFAMQQQHQQQQGLGRESPTGKLHIQLDECCIHVKRLEEERKMTEYELAKMHPGKRISSSNTIQAPQLPENPSQVDRVIVDVYKEHSRLVTLMSKIEGLCTESLHPNLEACLDSWMTSIQEAEARRQQEIRKATQHQQERNSPSSMNEEEVTQLADGIEKMKNATRAARTALWCAFQMAKQDKQEKENKENVRQT